MTAQQVLLAKRFSPRIIAGYDGDTAGINAAKRAISLCFENGVQIKILTLPRDSDPDAYIKKHGAEEFNNLVRQSVPGIKFLIKSQIQGKRIDIPEEKARIARNIIHETSKISDTIVLSEYIKQISEYLSIDESVLRTLIKQKPKAGTDQVAQSFLPAEKRLLQIVFENSQIASFVFKKMKDEDFQNLKGESIFCTLAENIRKGNKPSMHDFKSKIDPNLFSSLSEILQEKGEPPSLEEARDCIIAILQQSLEKQRKLIKDQIKKLGKGGDMEKLSPLLKQSQEITRELFLLSKQN